MSATIHSLPPIVALSQEPMSVTIATNNVASARAQLDIHLSSSGPGIDQVWTLGWAGKYLQFVFKGNPNGSGLHLPICDPSVGVTLRYVRELAEALTRHEWISDQFETITDPLTPTIILRSRFDTPLSIVSISPVSNFSVVVTNANSPYLKPNLTALLKVVSRKGREIAKLTGNYRIERGDLTATEGRADFPLGNLFDLAPHLPDEQTLDPSVPFSNTIAFRAYTQYFMRFADKYGTTPVAESLWRTAPYWVVFGGRSATSARTWAANAHGIYLCHPLQKGVVTRHQPTWLYFFNTERLNNVVVSVRAWTDYGVPYDVQIGSPHNLKANRLHYYRTGFEQLSLNAAFSIWNISDRIVAYEWRLIDALTQEPKLSMRYDFEDCRHDSLYLAFSNGLGGIDTLHVRGGYALKTEAERTIIRHTDEVAAYDPRIGSMATIDGTSQQIWELQTGLITLEYADYLRQLLTGSVWLIDTAQKRFLRLLMDSKSIETRTRIGGMVSLSFTFKAAWFDQNAV
jgi:hypothetical protein